MKKYLLILFAASLGFFGCRKNIETVPAPAVVGHWTVQPWLGDPIDAGVIPYVFFPSFELEILSDETGWIHQVNQDQALEWDLINGDRTIVLTFGNISFPNDSLIQAELYQIVHQNEESGEWVSPYVYSDTSTGITKTYPLHWFLQRKR